MSSSASLSEAQELYRLLEMCEEKLKAMNTLIGASTSKEAAEKLQNLRIGVIEVYHATRLLINAIQRISGNEELDKFMTKLEQTLSYLRMGMMMYGALMTGGPAGMFMFTLYGITLTSMAASGYGYRR